MNDKQRLWEKGGAICLAFFTGWAISCSGQIDPSGGPAKVEIRKTDKACTLYVNNRPFYIKGAGMGSGGQDSLARHGGNSLRTWGSNNGRAVLDRALTNGLYVTMGLRVGLERRGFDYNDTSAVNRQLETIKTEVMKYKDHPALIIWAIGNELNLQAKNPKVWDAVNDISKMIHQIDTNHLTTTPIAGINPQLIHEIKIRAPDLDLLAIQTYGGIVGLPDALKKSEWDKPYIITEWGATGYWEVKKTGWGAPIEEDSSVKADSYRKRYETVIAADRDQCLGSYVFLWGQKQERTPTWFGMFLESGEETESVDVMQYLWTGKWPENRSPRVAGAWLDGKAALENIRVRPNQTYRARISVADPDKDTLTYRWEVVEETKTHSTGGDREEKPSAISGLIQEQNKSEILMKAPEMPGAYRLFVYIFDGHGHAGHANIPFYVER